MNKWSIEDIELSLSFNNNADGSTDIDSSSSSNASVNSFKVEGLIAEGIQVINKKFELSEELNQQLSVCHLTWTLIRSSNNSNNKINRSNFSDGQCYFPLYLTKQRLILLSEILVPTSSTTIAAANITIRSENQDATAAAAVNNWIQRGVAIILQGS
jgi:hypothetical protein